MDKRILIIFGIVIAGVIMFVYITQFSKSKSTTTSTTSSTTNSDILTLKSQIKDLQNTIADIQNHAIRDDRAYSLYDGYYNSLNNNNGTVQFGGKNQPSSDIVVLHKRAFDNNDDPNAINNLTANYFPKTIAW